MGGAGWCQPDRRRTVHSSPSAKVQKFFGTEQERRGIGAGTDGEGREEKIFAFLTKIRVEHNNKV